MIYSKHPSYACITTQSISHFQIMFATLVILFLVIFFIFFYFKFFSNLVKKKKKIPAQSTTFLSEQQKFANLVIKWL